MRGVNGVSISGDSGISITSEYNFLVGKRQTDPDAAPRFVDKLRPFLFLDAGAIDNRQQDITSIGIGIGAGAKYYFKNNVIDVYAGFPLKSSGSLDGRGAEIGLNLSMKVF